MGEGDHGMHLSPPGCSFQTVRTGVLLPLVTQHHKQPSAVLSLHTRCQCSSPVVKDRPALQAPLYAQPDEQTVICSGLLAPSLPHPWYVLCA